MRLNLIKIFGLFIFLLPSVVQASVFINEVAWMGSLESANHEWIELYNSGDSAVSVDGWTLQDEANLNIKLAGEIPAYSFAVLERTSDNSAPGLAFLIYTGALVNTGATLTLRDENNSIMDQVFGGENWLEIGGDNVTKETAQYTASGWVTDLPTPGTVNRSGRVEVIEDRDKNSPSKDTKSLNEKTAIVISKDVVKDTPPLTLSILAPEITFVNQKTKFSAVAKTTQNSQNKLLIYNWNFGDSFTGRGRESEHVFSYPGSYVISVSVRVAGEEVIARREVKVLPVNFSLTKNENGDVQINNDALYAVDISGYKIVGSKTVVFPENSAILPKSTITIAKNRLLNTVDELIIFYDALGNTTASTWSKTNAFLEAVNSSFPVVLGKKEKVENIISSVDNFSGKENSENRSEENNKVVFRENPENIKVGEFGFSKKTADINQGEEDVNLITVPEIFALENQAVDFMEAVENSDREKLLDESVSGSKNENQVVDVSTETEEVEDFYTKKPESLPKERWTYLALIGLLSLALFGLYSGKR